MDIETKDFKELSIKQLEELQEKLKTQKRNCTKKYITPMEKQHLKPLKDKFIQPLIDKHIKPLDVLLKEIKKFLPKKNDKPVYLIFEGNKLGPLPRKNFMKMLVDADDVDEMKIDAK